MTENTLDHVHCFDPVVILTYAAAVHRTDPLGCSVVVLPIHSPLMVAHQWATASTTSATAARSSASGIGRDHHYRQFEVSEGGPRAPLPRGDGADQGAVDQDKVTTTAASTTSRTRRCAPKPVQKPHLPIWMGVGHPDAVRRAARLADGWMGSGGSQHRRFRRRCRSCKEALEKAGRDPETFPISKRIFMAVDESPEVARRRTARWFTEVYHNPPGTDGAASTARPSRCASGSRR